METRGEKKQEEEVEGLIMLWSQRILSCLFLPLAVYETGLTQLAVGLQHCEAQRSGSRSARLAATPIISWTLLLKIRPNLTKCTLEPFELFLFDIFTSTKCNASFCIDNQSILVFLQPVLAAPCWPNNILYVFGTFVFASFFSNSIIL